MPSSRSWSRKTSCPSSTSHPCTSWAASSSLLAWLMKTLAIRDLPLLGRRPPDGPGRWYPSAAVLLGVGLLLGLLALVRPVLAGVGRLLRLRLRLDLGLGVLRLRLGLDL